MWACGHVSSRISTTCWCAWSSVWSLVRCVRTPTSNDTGMWRSDPYLLALTVLVKRFCFCIRSDVEQGRIVVERRTPQLDREVEMGWGYLRTRGTRYVRPSLIARRVEAFSFVSKSDAPVGMELVDAVVSPLGRMLLGKRTLIDQSIVQAKLRGGPDGGEWLSLIHISEPTRPY